MASFALFNFEFEPIQNKLRQAGLRGWYRQLSIINRAICNELNKAAI